MAFATRTLIDTGKADGGAGKIVILLDLSDHDGSATALDADGLNGFANGAKLNIRRMRWALVSGDVSEDGSMIIAWSDTRNAIRDIYAQKIDSDGNYLWGEGGAVVADFEGRQEDPLLVRDGNGGAYIIWRDYRDENYYGDIYGQHIDANGNRLWDPNGVPLSNQSGEQSSHNLCVDGNGGAYALWVDKNGSGTYVGTHLGPNQSDIIAQGVGVLVSSYQNGGFSFDILFWTLSLYSLCSSSVDSCSSSS